MLSLFPNVSVCILLRAGEKKLAAALAMPCNVVA